MSPTKSGSGSGGTYDYSSKGSRKEIETSGGNGAGANGGNYQGTEMPVSGYGTTSNGHTVTVSTSTSAGGNTNSGVSTANASSNSVPAPSPLRSAEAFESYCSQVQLRLADHATHRIGFLQIAYDRLTRLLHTARAVEDTALYNELWQHRIAVRELLEALNHVSSGGLMPIPSANQTTPIATTTQPPGGMVTLNRAPGPVVAPSAPSIASSTSNGQGRLINGQVLPPSVGYGKPASPQGGNQPLAEQSGMVVGKEKQAVIPVNKPIVTPPTLNGYTAEPAAEITGNKPLNKEEKAEKSDRDDKLSKIDKIDKVDKNELIEKTGKIDKIEKPVEHLTEKQIEKQTEKQIEKNDAAVPADSARPTRHPVRPLSDIEADAIRLREQVKDWNSHFPLQVTDTSIPTLNVPNCLRLRAVACRMRRLEEEAGDMEVTEVTELGKDIEDLLDDAGDEEYTVALDYELEPLPTAYQWGELAERYEETARAQEAFEWWIEHRNLLSVADVQALAEAVAAIQQRFNRLLFRIGARDPFQQQLFDDLRVWAKEAQCYLYSLRPKVPIAELIEKAQSIDEAWDQARTPLRAQDERQKALDKLVQLANEEDLGTNDSSDASRFRNAVALCKDLKIPYAERRFRDAILPWTVFLEGDERFRELVSEIQAEWERRKESNKIDLGESEPPEALEDLKKSGIPLDSVRKVMGNRRCIIVGGVYREEIRQKLEELLEPAELLWPSSGPSDAISKFEALLEQSDIVVLVTRYSRREWLDMQEVCSQQGKLCVRIAHDQGVASIIRQIGERLKA